MHLSHQSQDQNPHIKMALDCKKLIPLFCVGIGLGLPLTGCSVAAMHMSGLGTEKTDWTDLRRTNHAAADQLFQSAQSQTTLNASRKIHLVQLNNLGTPPESGIAPISWVIPQQIGNRLAALGLNVLQPRVPPTTFSSQTDNIPLHMTQAASIETPYQDRVAGDLYLEGDYIYMRDSVLVSLRLVDGRENTLLSTMEYSLPVNADTYALLDARNEKARMFDDSWMRSF